MLNESVLSFYSMDGQERQQLEDKSEAKKQCPRCSKKKKKRRRSKRRKKKKWRKGGGRRRRKHLFKWDWAIRAESKLVTKEREKTAIKETAVRTQTHTQFDPWKRVCWGVREAGQCWRLCLIKCAWIWVEVVWRAPVYPMSFPPQGFQRSLLLCKSSTPEIKASQLSFIVCHCNVSATHVVKVQLVPVAEIKWNGSRVVPWPSCSGIWVPLPSSALFHFHRDLADPPCQPPSGSVFNLFYHYIGCRNQPASLLLGWRWIATSFTKKDMTETTKERFMSITFQSLCCAFQGALYQSWRA